MIATVTPILKLLEGSQQFVIPIYQRMYSWKKRHCHQLWEDVLRVGAHSEAPPHFFGSIVYMEPEPQNLGDVRKLLVIDGQQRLTTISLLLAALCRTIEEKRIAIGIKPEILSNMYLFNHDWKGELRYKQFLSQRDRDTMMRLLDNRELPEDHSSLLAENYQFFASLLKEANIEIVYRGIQKLKVVDLMLNRDQDNPQLIFESLNSTGLPLSQADLIRNYVLMGQEISFQTRLYNDYWFPMEEYFKKEPKLFDRFMRDYLTLKTERIPLVRKVYDTFKGYYTSRVKSPEDAEETVKAIYFHAKRYVDIAIPSETDPQLLECLEDIKDLEVAVVYPFLLGVYEDYAENRIEKPEVMCILRWVESYIFRRFVCDIPTKNVNKTFATLMRQIDKENYLESLKEAFRNMQGSEKYPDDSEFKEALGTKAFYEDKKRCRYLLRKLEHYKNKERVNVKDCTIEHVMPQNEFLSEEWQQELGEDFERIHRDYLHTLGNLTLTGYNPELSDRPFQEKKRMVEGGFVYSPLRLNRSLAKAENWNEAAIQNRAKELALDACKIWLWADSDA